MKVKQEKVWNVSGAQGGLKESHRLGGVSAVWF